MNWGVEMWQQCIRNWNWGNLKACYIVASDSCALQKSSVLSRAKAVMLKLFWRLHFPRLAQSSQTIRMLCHACMHLSSVQNHKHHSLRKCSAPGPSSAVVGFVRECIQKPSNISPTFRKQMRANGTVCRVEAKTTRSFNILDTRSFG